MRVEEKEKKGNKEGFYVKIENTMFYSMLRGTHSMSGGTFLEHDGRHTCVARGTK